MIPRCEDVFLAIWWNDFFAFSVWADRNTVVSFFVDESSSEEQKRVSNVKMRIVERIQWGSMNAGDDKLAGKGFRIATVENEKYRDPIRHEMLVWWKNRRMSFEFKNQAFLIDSQSSGQIIVWHSGNTRLIFTGPNRYLSMSNNRWTSWVNVQVGSVESTASSEQSQPIIDTDRRSFLLGMVSWLSTAILGWKDSLDDTRLSRSNDVFSSPKLIVETSSLFNSIFCPLWTRSNWVAFCTCRYSNKIDDEINF